MAHDLYLRDKYDAFISYRRESGAAEARLIRSELRDRQVRAFLDVDDLKAGHFDEALLMRIANAPNFIVILSPNALDRCSDERDWLRQEIAQAVKTGRNIIPILLRGFEFPDRGSLPDDLKSLPMHNGLEYSHKYFNAMIGEILSYLRTEDSLEQKQKGASEPAVQRVIDASYAVKPGKTVQMELKAPEPDTERGLAKEISPQVSPAPTKSDELTPKRAWTVTLLGALFWGGLSAIVGSAEFGSHQGGVKSPFDLVILISIGVILGGVNAATMAASRRGRQWGAIGIVVGMILGAIRGGAEGSLTLSLLFGMLSSLFGAVTEQNRKSKTKT